MKMIAASLSRPPKAQISSTWIRLQVRLRKNPILVPSGGLTGLDHEPAYRLLARTRQTGYGTDGMSPLPNFRLT
jgi:hypothetical protein